MISVFCGAAALIAYLFLFLPDTSQPRILKLLIVSQVATALYMFMIARLKKTSAVGLSKNIFYTLFALGLVIRVVFVAGSGQQTWLSDDIYRYVWEGKLVLNGVNPYYYSPSDLECSDLADSTIFPGINHPELPAIYPPMAQYLFAVSYLVGGDSFNGFKLLSILFELLTLAAILVLIRKYGYEKWSVFIYLFSPLILIEFLYSSHLDILALPFFITSMICLKEDRPVLGGFTLALTILVKLTGLLFLPVYFFSFKSCKRWLFLTVFTFVCLITYLPFILMPDRAVIGSLGEYLGSWQWNSFVFQLSQLVIGEIAARILCAIALVGSILFASLSGKTSDSFQRLFWAAGAYVIFSPALYPWYLAWLLPFLVINKNSAFLLLTGTSLLSYHVLIEYYATGEWYQLLTIPLLEYIPFFGLLLLGMYRQLASKDMKHL